MTERVQNPGAPRTDELARGAALNEIVDQLVSMPPIDEEDLFLYNRTRTAIDRMLNEYTVTFETDINANGVPVRRVVLRGAWEVDPQPPAYEPRKGDVVRHKGGEPIVTNDGVIPADAEWIVSSVPYTVSRDPGYTMVFIRQPGWSGDKYIINTTARMLEIVRRPEGVKP